MIMLVHVNRDFGFSLLCWKPYAMLIWIWMLLQALLLPIWCKWYLCNL